MYIKSENAGTEFPSWNGYNYIDYYTRKHAADTTCEIVNLSEHGTRAEIPQNTVIAT